MPSEAFRQIPRDQASQTLETITPLFVDAWQPIGHPSKTWSSGPNPLYLSILVTAVMPNVAPATDTLRLYRRRPNFVAANGSGNRMPGSAKRFSGPFASACG